MNGTTLAPLTRDDKIGFQSCNVMTHSALKDSPLHVLWDPKTLLWVILAAEAIAVVLSLAPGLDTSWIDFGITSFAIQWAVLLTLGGLYLMRHRLAKARPLTIANLALLFLFIAATTVIAAAIAVVGNAWSMGIKQWMGLLLRIYGITVTVGLLGIMAFRSHWLARQFAVKAKQFELDALQARIQPHFLFNTLNTGAALVRLHPAKAEQLLMDLAELSSKPRRTRARQPRRRADIGKTLFGDRADAFG